MTQLSATPKKRGRSVSPPFGSGIHGLDPVVGNLEDDRADQLSFRVESKVPLLVRCRRRRLAGDALAYRALREPRGIGRIDDAPPKDEEVALGVND